MQQNTKIETEITSLAPRPGSGRKILPGTSLEVCVFHILGEAWGLSNIKRARIADADADADARGIGMGIGRGGERTMQSLESISILAYEQLAIGFVALLMFGLEITCERLLLTCLSPSVFHTRVDVLRTIQYHTIPYNTIR